MRRLAPLALLLAATALAQEPKGPEEPKAPAGEAADDTLARVSFVLDPGWHTAHVRTLAFAPSGHLISYARDHMVRITDPLSGVSRALPVPGLPDAMNLRERSDTDRAAVSADGTRIAVPARYPKSGGFEHVVYVLSLPEGKVVRTIGGFEPNEHVQAVSVSRDGKKVAVVGAFAKSALRVWAEGAERPEVLPVGGARNLAFCPAADAADQLAVSFARPNDIGLMVYDVGTGKAVAAPVTTGTVQHALAWSANGTRLATTGPTNATVKAPVITVWSADLKPMRVLENNIDRTVALAFSPKADRLLAAMHPGHNNHRAVVFDLATGGMVSEVDHSRGKWPGGKSPGYVANVSDTGAWDPNGETVATGGGSEGAASTWLWNATTADLVRDFHNREWLSGAAGATRAAWSADGKAVAWSNGQNTPSFSFAELTRKAPAPKERFAGAISMAAGATIERKGGSNKAVRVDGDKRGIPFGVDYGSGWTFLRPNDPDRAVISSFSGTRLYDTKTGKRLLTYERSGLGWDVAASPDGRFLFVPTGAQVGRVYRPDSEKLLMSLYMTEPRPRPTNVAKEKAAAMAPAEAARDWVVWTPQGYYAASPNGERLIAWKVDNGRDAAPSYYPAEQFRDRLYRPDVIKLVLETGDVGAAVAKADALLGKKAVAPAAVRDVSAVLPPGVTVAVDQTTQPATVTVTAKATAAGQNVKSLRLLVDGRRLRDEDETTARKGAFVEFEAGKEPAEVTQVWKVNLPPGRHAVSALARSTDDTPSFSPPREVLVTGPPGFRPKLHVLAVGVSQYQTVRPNLRFAASDADLVAGAFGALVENGLAYQKGHMPKPLTDANATTKNVLKALDEAREKVEPGDLFVFFFAGHGTRDGGEFFLVSHDTNDADADKLRQTALSGSDVRAKLADFRCQVLMVLDACHGGQIAGMPPGGDEAARRMAAADARVAVLCAAQGHQKSAEENGAGVFTAALAKALADPKGAKAFFDPVTGELNVGHLYAFVYQEVIRDPARDQTPYLRLPLAHPAVTVTQVKIKGK
jgi:WD40 repeat protein